MTYGSIAEAGDGRPCKGRRLLPLTVEEALSHLILLPEWGAGTPAAQQRSAGCVSPLQSACVLWTELGGWQEEGQGDFSSAHAELGI